MVVVGSVYEKNKIIKDPDQEIYARHFDRSLIRKLSLSRFAQAAHPSLLRTCQNNGKISMVLDLLFFYFVFLRYLKFTGIKSNKSNFTVCMFYYIALHFQDNRKLKFSHFNLVRIKIKDFPNISLNRCLIIFLDFPPSLSNLDS